MKTTIQLPSQTESAMRRLRDDAGMLAHLVPIMDRENEVAVAHIQATRFSRAGPESLAVRTGRLRRSLRPVRAVVLGNSVRSAIGSNVKYLGVHEFGIHESVNVRPHARKRTVKQIIFGKKRTVRLGDVPVRGHAMRMNLPERAPLRRGIGDRQGDYGRALVGGVVEFYKGK